MQRHSSVIIPLPLSEFVLLCTPSLVLLSKLVLLCTPSLVPLSELVLLCTPLPFFELVLLCTPLLVPLSDLVLLCTPHWYVTVHSTPFIYSDKNCRAEDLHVVCVTSSEVLRLKGQYCRYRVTHTFQFSKTCEFMH